MIYLFDLILVVIADHITFVENANISELDHRAEKNQWMRSKHEL